MSEPSGEAGRLIAWNAASHVRGAWELMRRLPRMAYAAGEASNALNLILLALIARLMGVEPYGDFVAILAAAGILGELIEFGFPVLITRSVARRPDAAWSEIKQVLWRQALMIAPMIAVLYAYLRASQIDEASYAAGLLIGGAVAVRAMKATLRGVCRALHQFTFEAAFLWTERIGLFSTSLALIGMGKGLTGVGIAFLGVRALDFIVFLAMLRARLVKQSAAEPGWLTWRQAWPLAVAGLLWSLYYQVDTAMLPVLSSARETGVYGAVFRFVDILAVIPRLVIVVAYPAMSLLWTRDHAGFENLFGRLRTFTTAAGVPVLLGLMLTGRFLLVAIFGPEYEAGEPALRLILFGLFFTFHTMLMSQTLTAAGQEARVAAALGWTVALNVTLNFFLIPAHGHFGAAISTLAAEAAFYVALKVAAVRRGVIRGRPVGWVESIGIAALAASLFAAESMTPLAAGLLWVLVTAVCAIRILHGRLWTAGAGGERPPERQGHRETSEGKEPHAERQD